MFSESALESIKTDNLRTVVDGLTSHANEQIKNLAVTLKEKL